MRRTARLLFALSAFVSLLLCIGAAILWVRSYSGTDYVQRSVQGAIGPYAIEHTSRGIAWTRGAVRLFWSNSTYFPHGHLDVSTMHAPATVWGHGRLGPGHILGWERPAPKTFWERMGFITWDDGFITSFSSDQQTSTAGPAWLFVVLFALLPVIWLLRRWRTRRQRMSGCCIACGYDLRASTGRCPECGRIDVHVHLIAGAGA